MSRTEPGDLAERGRRVLALEAEAIRRVAEHLGSAFSAAVREGASAVVCASTGNTAASAAASIAVRRRREREQEDDHQDRQQRRQDPRTQTLTAGGCAALHAI